MGLFNINKLTSNISDYIDTRVELIKLDTQEQIIKAVIILFEFLLVFVFLGIVWVFLNLTLAYYLNSRMGGNYIGFMLVAGLHTLALLWLWFNKRKVRRKLERTMYQMIAQIEKKHPNDDNEKKLPPGNRS
ncbi:hypothetical protein BKI52_01335 [marine bacterium AO1-C]|nr:hypothetical protein BKI52_01335 [marine bacterium AO1-C]